MRRILRISRYRILSVVWVTLLLFSPFALRAQLVVDAFPAWDGQAVGNRWIPLVVEISNKGVPLQGVIEVSSSTPFSIPAALCAVEIPSQTNKRVWVYIPPMAYPGDMKVRILNHRGKVLTESPLKIVTHPLPSRLVAESIPSGWLKMGLNNQVTNKMRQQWSSTRALKQHLPDDAVGYDGLTALHLGWSEVSDLLPTQRQALIDWVLSGGHLIVSAEDVNAWRSDPWWGSILPVAVASQQSVPGLTPLQTWLDGQRSIVRPVGDASSPSQPSDVTPTPAPIETPIAEMETLLGTGGMVRGHALIERDGVPLVARRRLGRGMITQLLFNPGREPFRSWQGRSDFWLYLLQGTRETMEASLEASDTAMKPNPPITPQAGQRKGGRRGGGLPRPPMNYNTQRYIQPSSVESFALNLLSTRQQRTLPWLLLGVVLVAYILLIGPFDYVWLKRRRKLVWTWVTFPSYVIATTLIIYGLGYWVNSGESEWRQWTVLDWFPGAGRQRATTMAEFYSTRNSHYQWSDVRGLITHVHSMEAGFPGRIEHSDTTEIVMTPSGSEVRSPVPVWTSRGYLGRFSQSGQVPQAEYVRDGETLTLTNPTQTPWKNCRWVTEPGKYKPLGNLRPGETKTWKLGVIAAAEVDRGADSMMGFNYRGYGQDQQTELTDDQMMNASLVLFFLPARNASCQIGSVGEGLDLFEGWQEGDALFVAMSEIPRDWPWQLAFTPRRITHRVLNRIYFPSDTPPAKEGPTP